MNKYDFDDKNLLCFFKQYPDVINDRLKLYGLLKDYFPEQTMMIRVFMVAYDMGIAEEIRENEITLFLYNRLISSMINEYGVKDDIAVTIVSLWCEVYARGILNKDISGLNEKPGKKISDNVRQYAHQSSMEQTQNDFGIDRTKHKNGDKYSKEIVVRNLDLEEAFNIASIEYTVHENNGYLEIIGSIEVTDTSLEYLLCCNIYDRYNRLIRYQTSAPVEINSKRNEFDFEFSFDIPKDIIISKILLFPMFNPYVT